MEKKIIQRVLNCEDKVIVSDRRVTSHYDSSTQTLHLTFDVSPQELANIAKADYEDGLTHEQVTARLEACTPDFRKVLAECFTEDGSKFWVLKPTIISMQFIVEKDKKWTPTAS
jgi:hypothetical protein